MVEIPDELCCVFHATIDEQDGSYVLEIPAHEVSPGTVRDGVTYRVALMSPTWAGSESASAPSNAPDQESASEQSGGAPDAPVSIGDRYTVDIDSLGEQGDGIARVERGYVVIVPDTELGERVTIEIDDVTKSVGFGTVVRREPYYE